jgi:transposase
VVQRWILARLRKHTFFSLDELNAHIRVLLDDLNNRQMRRYGTSRRERFEEMDRPALRPLPATPYTFAIWSKTRVERDYHIDVDGHFYSVPHRLVGEYVEARATAHTVEVLRRGVRVAVHVRSPVRGEKTTTPDHMPTAHRKHLEWTPERIATWAAEIGPGTATLVEAILRERPHPQQGFRSCLGILRLQKRYGPERLERACQRAGLAGARSYRHIESILKNGLDRLEPAAPADKVEPTTHENVRGAAYYH